MINIEGIGYPFYGNKDDKNVPEIKFLDPATVQISEDISNQTKVIDDRLHYDPDTLYNLGYRYFDGIYDWVDTKQSGTILGKPIYTIQQDDTILGLPHIKDHQRTMLDFLNNNKPHIINRNDYIKK